jgi:hypothetical protein
MRPEVSWRPMTRRTTRTARLSRKEWSLVALGLGAWIALGAGGVWFVHQLTRPRDSCAGAAEPQTKQVQASTNPGNALQLLTGQGRCK